MTAPVCVRAPAKINLHLEVLGLRADGFHELAMVMQSIDLADEFECENTADGTLSLSCDQPGLSCGDDNLIMRAARLLRERSGFGELGARMHLRKRIPIGAGLAGGSSDGAAALVGLNTLWGLGLSASSSRRWLLILDPICRSALAAAPSSVSDAENGLRFCLKCLRRLAFCW